MYDQLADAMTIFSEAKNIFPYWQKETLRQWEDWFEGCLPQIVEGMSERAFYLHLMKGTAQLNDGHTTVYPPQALARTTFSPISFCWIENQLCISKTTAAYQQFLYQPIRLINGLTPEDFLAEKVLPYFWHEKINFALQEFTDYAFFILQENYTLTFALESIEIPFESESPKFVERNTLPKTAKWIAENSSAAFYQLADKAYIQLKNFASEAVVRSFYDQLPWLSKQTALIFDLRNNPGGNSGYADQICQAFFTERFPVEGAFRQVIDLEKYANGSQLLHQQKETWEASELECLQTFQHQYLEKSEEYSFTPEYCGKLADMPVMILQNEGTYSSAENFLIAFDTQQRATLIGTASAGSTGQPAWISLKTGGIFQITAKKVCYPDGRPHHNIGVLPQRVIQTALADYQADRDPALEEATRK